MEIEIIFLSIGMIAIVLIIFSVVGLPTLLHYAESIKYQNNLNLKLKIQYEKLKKEK